MCRDACRDSYPAFSFEVGGEKKKRSRHSRRMRNPQVYVSGKRPMTSNALVNISRDECLPPTSCQPVTQASHVLILLKSQWYKVVSLDPCLREVCQYSLKPWLVSDKSHCVIQHRFFVDKNYYIRTNIKSKCRLKIYSFIQEYYL